MRVLTGIFLAVAAVMAPSRGASAADPLADGLARSIASSGMKRVGVIPRFIQREGDKETLAGSMGPQGEWLAEELVDALIEKGKGEYKFKIVDPGRMSRAFKDAKVTIADLDSPDSQRKIAQLVGGLDGLIVGRAEDTREIPAPGAIAGRLKDISVKCRLIDIRSGDVAGVAKQAIPVTPQLRVYRGEANEVDRDALKQAGLPGDKGRNIPDQAAPTEGGSKPETLHPFEKPHFPLPLWIMVDGKKRDFIVVRDPKTGRRELYAPIEPGESYQIRCKNNLPGVLYMSMFVDGVNVLEKKRDLANPKYWYLEPGAESMIHGWYTSKPASPDKYNVEPFIVAPADDSVAAGENFRDELGMITIVYFLPAAATPYTKPADTTKPSAGTAKGLGEKSLTTGTVATSAGAAEEQKVETHAGAARGKFLAGFVIHYAPRSQIQKLPTVSP
jgi:hypothetical protein